MRGDLNSKMNSVNQAFHNGSVKYKKAIDDIIMQANEYELEARETIKNKSREAAINKK